MGRVLAAIPTPPSFGKKCPGTSRPGEKLCVFYEEFAEFPERAVNNLVY
jgi:hypothetical protein